MTEKFEARIKKYQIEKKQIEEKSRNLVNLRGLFAIIFIVTAFHGINGGFLWTHYLIGIVAAVIFCYFVYKHTLTKVSLELVNEKIRINERQKKRLTGEWTSFTETGEDEIDVNHPYLVDLDILGEGSLYQHISDAKTYYGHQFLKDVLLKRDDLHTIKDRQHAIAEISKNTEFTENFKAIMGLTKGLGDDPAELIKFLEEPDKAFKKVRYAFLLTLGLIILPVVNLIVPSEVWVYLFVGLFAVQALVFVLYLPKTSQILGMLGQFKRSMGRLKQIIQLIQRTEFEADLNKKMRTFLVEDKDPIKFISALNRIETAVSFRQSGLFFLALNLGFLWDINCVLSLEDLKTKSNIATWLRTIGFFEVLVSLGNIGELHPDWVMPQFTTDMRLEMEEMSHPLLQDAVPNTYTHKNISLITGSNMSGKTTFLRAIGTNLVLAYVGAPVPARLFRVPLMDIYTCMRTIDNLQENKSTFYAELTRLKRIIDRAEQKAPMLFLIDEIFRGTNSEDRITGAKQILHQLNQPHLMGLLTTHDLAICEVDSFSGFSTYHFKEYYEDGEIQFDYKIRNGRSTTRNAKYLMAMVGIK